MNKDLTSENAQTNEHSNSLDNNSDDIFSSDSSLDENSESNSKSDNLDKDDELDDENEHFNEFALKHISELLINLLTFDDKNAILHLNTHFELLNQRVQEMLDNQKVMIKSIEENTKVNKLIAKILEKKN